MKKVWISAKKKQSKKAATSYLQILIRSNLQKVELKLYRQACLQREQNNIKKNKIREIRQNSNPYKAAQVGATWQVKKKRDNGEINR
jgi:CRISPR/Cas system-associated protein endoribonuclease Cas2